ASAYASQLLQIWPMIDGCVEGHTPWSFPGLAGYLKTWKEAPQLPAEGTALSAEAAASLSWWPTPGTLRGKRPEESEAHYWPCAPLRDRSCFPSGSGNVYASCETCCDPGKGPTGDPACFVGEYTFARCCQTPGGSGRFY
ncbi:unnamed protein product, partial [Polarella glacialis]